MKFLILGCNGMAGHVISLYLRDSGHEVVGFAREKSKFIKTIIGDASNFSLLKRQVLSGGYDTVINCIGVLNQFAERNHANAVLINGYLPQFLADITRGTNIQIIQMSTDCVFSGKTGGYTEDSLPDGTLFYDRSKAIGELDDPQNVTLRNSIIGPDMKQRGIGLLNWFMQQTGPVKGYTGVIWTGQTTLQLAKTMEEAATRRVHGLYNMVPSESINKYELLQLFNKYIRKEQIEIIPDNKIAADKSLIRTKFEDFDYSIPGYEAMIRELGDWMREHRELYPHYDL